MKIRPSEFWGILLVLGLLFTQSGHAQEEKVKGTILLDSLIKAELFDEANLELETQISAFLTNNQIDSLAKYPIYVGKIAAGQRDNSYGAAKAEEFISGLKEKSPNARTLYKAYLSLDKMYVALGDDQTSLEASLTALEYANEVPDIQPDELGKINYAIGGNYYALYQLENALSYFEASAGAYEKSETVDKDILADSYNGVAVCLWTLNKLDGAELYFNKAIKATEQSALEGFDRIYYIVAFEFNLALVIEAQGKLGKAIEMKKEIIPQLQEIIDNSNDDFLVKKSKRLVASAISNLAAFYNDTGHLTKAYEMLLFSYEKKKEVFEKSSPRMATALTQIALSEYELRDFEKSIRSTDTAMKNLKESPSRYPSVEADILSVKAKATAALGDVEEAKILFEESIELFEEAYPDEFSREYLILLRDYAQFLAKNENPEKAIQIASDSYEYVLKNGGSQNFPLVKEITNLAEVYYESGQFDKAYEWALKGNLYLDERMATTESEIDSIQIEFQRPAITMLEVRSQYESRSNPDLDFLQEQLDKIDKAVNYLERRKTSAINIEDVNNILTEYRGINELSKKINIELFDRTRDSLYLDEVISLHESGIYNRIRTQFNIKNTLRFGGLPEQVLEREKLLKNNISAALVSEENDINDYFSANEAWKLFLDSLRTDHPKYYELKYSTIEQSLGNIQKSIPEITTVVRFLFIDEQLHGYVMSTNVSELIPLSFDNVPEKIKLLGEDQSEIELISPILHELYVQLWQPLEEYIQTEKIIIIPDRELFNLSFESLTSKPIESFTDMATESLLARHSISYNYSLFLLANPGRSFDYEDNYIAFAPEFSSSMKENYKVAVADSASIDKSYVTLLPQPFSVDLVKKYSKIFSGSSFLNEKSTKQIFKEEAKEHKIIHIGTHAESNNLTPEFSRLIFAKNISDEGITEDNSLFTYEIYDYNLSSNLTILTACETGKPAFEPGEGMISLAHAFNYAGSESMLTSLWKIDEKSSTEIIGFFYDNLKEGMSKDDALRQAKLTYLATANGRTLAPNYWAGLILMGDSSSISLDSGMPVWMYLLPAFLILLLIYFFLKRRQKV